MTLFCSNHISSEAAKLCKIRLDKPSHRRLIPTHPTSRHTITRMKVLGVHWTINSFARALRRDYIELISRIPRYSKIGLLPRTASGLPYLPPGLSETIDTPTQICTSALSHFYNDFYQLCAHWITRSPDQWTTTFYLKKDLWGYGLRRTFAHSFWVSHNHNRRQRPKPLVAPSIGNTDTPSPRGVVAKSTGAGGNIPHRPGKERRSPEAFARRAAERGIRQKANRAQYKAIFGYTSKGEEGLPRDPSAKPQQLGLQTTHVINSTTKSGKLRLLRTLPPETIINHKDKTRNRLTMATLNVNGLGASTDDFSLVKIPDIINLMMKNKIDILAIQETRRPFSEPHSCKGYSVLLSSANADPRAQDKSADFMYKKANSLFKGKRALTNKITAKTLNKARADKKNLEFAGVGFVISPQWIPYIREYRCVSSREMHLTINTTGALTTLINMYLPQNGLSWELRELWYSRLTQAFTSYPKHYNTIVTGDLNAQIHQRLPSETDCLGTHAFGTYEQAVAKAANTQDNRGLFIEFLRDTKSTPINTHFMKSDKQLITHRRPGAKDWDINYTNFATNDYIVCKDKYKDQFIDCHSNISTAFASDHFPLIAKCKGLFTKKKKPPPGLTKWDLPTTAQIQLFNEEIKNSSPNTIIDWQNAVFTSRDHHFPKKDPNAPPIWMTIATQEILKERQRARDLADWPLEKIINRKLQQAVKDDKLRQRLSRLENHTWQDTTFVWKKRMPQNLRIKDADGLPTSSINRANTLADHLQDKQWASPPLPTDPLITYKDNPLLKIPEINCEDYTIEEFNAAIASSKPKKTPGPDQIPADHWKFLDEDNRHNLLAAINTFANLGTLPDSLKLANVVLIHKKGKLDDPANYRPISLLDSILKIYCIMLRIRIQDGVEHLLHDEQYGFRPKRSTSQPLFTIRRLAEMAEEGQIPSVIAFLDWEKAFDSLNHQALFQILDRMKFPKQIIDQIKAIYSGPLFKVLDPNGNSDAHHQSQGIRQGCTISPYLFNLVMHTLIFDTTKLASRGGISRLSEVINSSFILYADDTAIIGDPSSVNINIHCLQRQAALIGLSLNEKKCEFLAFACEPSITYRNGKPLTKALKAKYLGGIISCKSDPSEDLANRLSIASREFYKCKDIWDHPKLVLPWKLQIYEAKIASTLIYGIDTLTLSPPHLAKLDYLNARCLRRIMSIPAAYISRVSNQTVFNRAARANGKKKYISTGKKIKSRQCLLLGHIIRNESTTDHAKLACINDDGRRVSIFSKRIGRPRSKWLKSVTNRIWKALLDMEFHDLGPIFDETDDEHVITLYGAAYDRIGPFKPLRKPGKIRDLTGKKKRNNTKKESFYKRNRDAKNKANQPRPPSPHTARYLTEKDPPTLRP